MQAQGGSRIFVFRAQTSLFVILLKLGSSFGFRFLSLFFCWFSFSSSTPHCSSSIIVRARFFQKKKTRTKRRKTISFLFPGANQKFILKFSANKKNGFDVPYKETHRYRVIWWFDWWIKQKKKKQKRILNDHLNDDFFEQCTAPSHPSILEQKSATKGISGFFFSFAPSFSKTVPILHHFCRTSIENRVIISLSEMNIRKKIAKNYPTNSYQNFPPVSA